MTYQLQPLSNLPLNKICLIKYYCSTEKLLKSRFNAALTYIAFAIATKRTNQAPLKMQVVFHPLLTFNKLFSIYKRPLLLLRTKFH